MLVGELSSYIRESDSHPVPFLLFYIMKILFLDVDGVLNNANTLKNQGRTGWPLNHLDASRIELLNQIVEETDCRIVLSSSWRVLFEWSAFAQVLTQKGFRHPDKFIGQTPRANFDNRGMEIAHWLQQNKEVTSFVILDDDADMAHLLPHLVQTSWLEGLTPEVTKQVISHLTTDQILFKVGV